jgi:uncharacterized membrane protein
MATQTTEFQEAFAVGSNRLALGLARHWLAAFLLAWGTFVGLPWLAPVLMHSGQASLGHTIYLFYSTQCHQLPERSFFLFGPKAMYSLAEVRAVWPDSQNVLGLRRFVGNEAMGWKVAWSDRMVSMWTSIWFGGLLYALFRRRLKPLPMWAFVLLALPMAVDGGTHFLADLTAPAFGLGFRDNNAWLAALTHNAFPINFYAGDAIGSFNSWMRLLTGTLFGLGAAWVSLPYLAEFFDDTRYQIEDKFRRAGLHA